MSEIDKLLSSIFGKKDEQPDVKFPPGTPSRVKYLKPEDRASSIGNLPSTNQKGFDKITVQAAVSKLDAASLEKMGNDAAGHLPEPYRTDYAVLLKTVSLFLGAFTCLNEALGSEDGSHTPKQEGCLKNAEALCNAASKVLTHIKSAEFSTGRPNEEGHLIMQIITIANDKEKE